MNTKTYSSQTVFGKLIQPFLDLIGQCNHKRKCNVLGDQEWIETGLQRILSHEPSGRAFLQKLFDTGKSGIKRSHFFETLKSKRRLRFCREAGFLLFQKMKQHSRQLSQFSSLDVLDGYDVYAGDGHYHKAATHDTKKSGKKHPTQHFYCVDLRSHALRHLTLADTSGTRKREHDTRALKRLNIETLRQSAPKGRKVLYVWDRAGIDFLQWFKWKHGGGIYFISREKKNMDLEVIGELFFDRQDPINAGVERYDLVGCSAGVSMQRVTYTCPLTNETYNFVTSLTNFPPGLIAYLYKLRWDIEKVFDQVKNKLSEAKAWATSDTAKNMQAEFICMAHNLMVMFKKCLEHEGAVNETENTRRRKRLEKSLAKAKTKAINLPNFLKTPRRPTQLSVKYIRWLRNHLYSNTSWREAVSSLVRVYAVF